MLEGVVICNKVSKSAAVDVGKKLVTKALTPKSKKNFTKIYGARNAKHYYVNRRQCY